MDCEPIERFVEDHERRMTQLVSFARAKQSDRHLNGPDGLGDGARAGIGAPAPDRALPDWSNSIAGICSRRGVWSSAGTASNPSPVLVYNPARIVTGLTPYPDRVAGRARDRG